jgi:hypothetical protein
MDYAGQKGTEEAFEEQNPVKVISRTLRRTPAAVRQKARQMGISIGHKKIRLKTHEASARSGSGLWSGHTGSLG